MNSEIFRTVHLKFSDEELAAIDVWQDQQKIRTRSEAIRQLIRRGMEGAEGVKSQAHELSEKPRQFLSAPSSASRPGPEQAQPMEALQRLVREEVAKALSEMLKREKS